jgi:hypothetical protein
MRSVAMPKWTLVMHNQGPLGYICPLCLIAKGLRL